MREAVILAFALLLAAVGCDERAGAPGPGSAGGTTAGDGSDGASAGTQVATDTGAPATTDSGEPLRLGDACDAEDDACGQGLRCLFGICEWACGYDGLCCPEGQICGGIEWECEPASPLWCGNACDGQAWHECDEGETCVLDEDGAGHCEPG